MPEVLELKPLKNKMLKLILVESEFPIDWWFEVPETMKDNIVWNLHLISKEYIELMEILIEKYKPHLVLEERPNFWNNALNSVDPLKALFERKDIPFKQTDISENAENYLFAALSEHREMIKSLEKKITQILKIKGKAFENDDFFQRLVLWKEYMQKDYEQEEDKVRYNVREAWMMMNILNLARDIEDKKIKGIFICDTRHFAGIEKLASDLGIQTEQVKIKRRIKSLEVEKALEDEIEIALLK